MPRVDDVRAVTRRPLLRWGAFCALLALAATFFWWQLDHGPLETPRGGDATPGPAGSWSVLAASALLAGLAGWILMRVERAGSQARRTRIHLQALSDVLDVWQWQTDAQHRLVQTRPPVGAPTADWLAAATQPLWGHFRPADEPGLRARMAMGAALDDVEVWRRGSDGALRPGLLRGRAVSDASGGFAGYIGTLRDASVAALPPPAPAAAPEAAATADGEPDHESFGYTVSHDLRAPIRVVEGFTKIVKEDYGSVLDRVGHDHLDRVLGAAARMNGMIDALLALSKLSSQPLARQPVNLSQLAGFVADDLRRLWPDRQVTFEVMPGMEVPGDPTLLRVVLENLLGNAWKYTGHCGHAQIRFERSSGEPPTFTISDNGAGFDMRFADRLFGVFQRLHSASEFPGTGVGLASVRRIIRRHGGEIWAEAELERGARFHFTLPVDAARR
jgi:signal transduction histidine kinase